MTQSLMRFAAKTALTPAVVGASARKIHQHRSQNTSSRELTGGTKRRNDQFDPSLRVICSHRSSLSVREPFPASCHVRSSSHEVTSNARQKIKKNKAKRDSQGQREDGEACEGRCRRRRAVGEPEIPAFQLVSKFKRTE